jgi:PQQ-dependent catabolism-associated beta-propeller protein
MRSAIPVACVLAIVSLNAHAGRAYVSNEDGHSVTVIDTGKNEAIATVPVGKRPRGMKLSPDEKTLYIAVSGLPKCPPTVPDEECAKLERDLKADGIAVLDTTTLKLSKVIQAGSDPEQFDISADGKRMYVANEDTATTTVLELPAGTIKAKIPVGREPEGVRVSPDGKWVLVTNESDNSISVIDTQTLKVQRSVKVGQRPRDIAFTPDSRSAFVSGEFDASLYRIAIPAGQPVERVVQLRKEAKPMSVSLDPDRQRIYLSTGRGGTVAVIASDTLTLIKELPVGTRPWGIALSADGRRLYTANGPSNDVSVVDTQKLQIVKKIPVGRSPWTVVLSK